VAILLEDGRFSTDLALNITTAFAELGEVEVIAVDVPIGFGPREADAAARQFLKGAASTVFSTPRRALLDVPFRPGLGISKQAHSLGPRILHVTSLAATDARLYEVHPEVCFRAMNGGVPLRNRKKWADGALERIDLLRRHGIELTELRTTASAPLDDVLDAAAAAWSAHRIAAGIAQTLPSSPEFVDGRDIAIWY
jgi:predicted RNase H-like nuclease